MQHKALLTLLFLFALICLFPACDPGGDPPVPVPNDCGYNLPTLPYSNPSDCRPQLVEFRDLSSSIVNLSDGKLPALPNDCSAEGRTRTMDLEGIDDDGFTLHVYNGTNADLQFRVYGTTDCNDIEPVTDCLVMDAAAGKIAVEGLTKSYHKFFVRFSLDALHASPIDFTQEDFVALAAYDDAEPGSEGSIEYNRAPTTDNKGRLAFSCDGTSFQRVIMSSCGAGDLRQWVAASGLTPDEEYYGPLGGVVVVGIPPGLDPNGTGGALSRRRGRGNGNGLIAEPDYLINLFNPTRPSQTGGALIDATLDPVLVNTIDNVGPYLRSILPPFDPPTQFGGGTPLLATIIDSGVELESENEKYWKSTQYLRGRKTEYIHPGSFGYDFIAKDFAPNDVTPHGTAVAGALLGQYQRPDPLQTVHFKIFGREGISSYFGALVSILEATTIGSDVINMSWGFYLHQRPAALDCVVGIAATNGVLMLTSAGNDQADLSRQPQWPAALAPSYPGNLLTVASYWYQGEAASRDPNAVDLMYFSNFGDGVVPTAAFMTTPVPRYGTKDTYFPLGTSISTPIASGMLLENLGTSGSGFNALFPFRRKAPGLSGVITNANYVELTVPKVPRP